MGTVVKRGVTWRLQYRCNATPTRLNRIWTSFNHAVNVSDHGSINALNAVYPVGIFESIRCFPCSWLWQLWKVDKA